MKGDIKTEFANFDSQILNSIKIFIDTKVLRDYWISHAALPTTVPTALPVNSEVAALPATPTNAPRSAHNINDYINAALPATSINAALPVSQAHAALPAPPAAALPAMYVPTVSKSRYGRLRQPKRS